MTSPCPKCPFRTDIQPFLTKDRAREIVNVLIQQQGTFQCHQTVDYDKADDDGVVPACVAAQETKAQHCAGALILLEHMHKPNQLMRIMERLGGYDRRLLKMTSPVFTTVQAFVQAQIAGRRRR